MENPAAQTLEVFVQSQALNGLRILHLSDLHINKNTSLKELENFIQICHELEYDFAVITGDIIDCKVKFVQQQLKILNQLNQKPCYFISGNHDVVYGLEELKQALSHLIFLDNKIKAIRFNDQTIYLAGLADRFAKIFNVKREERTIFEALKEHEDTIFIAHQPKDYKLAVNANSNLFLCGHTHGGQIFPFHYFVQLFQPFISGLHYRKKTAIYVNKGLGTWGIDFRFKAPSEITVLKLITKSVE